MSERHIVRKDNVPVMFKTSGAPTVQYVRCNKHICEPQNYKPSGQHNRFCHKTHRKHCHD